MKTLYGNKKTISDFVVLLYITALLIIDFLPYFKSMEIINPQFLYLSIVNLLMGVYLYSTSGLVVSEAFQIVKKSYISRIYLLFLFFCLLSFTVAKNTSISITKFTELIIVFCLFINLTILLKEKLDLLYKVIFIVCLSAFFQAGHELYLLRKIAKGDSIIAALGYIKGNTGNINILAASLTVKVPFIILGIFRFTFFKRFFLIINLILVTTIIILTGARSSLINLFLIFTVYIIYYFRENSFQKATLIKTLILIIPILSAIFISNEIFEKSKDKSRYVSVQNRISQIKAEDASINKRLEYWRNTIKMTSSSPLLGIGLGNYQVESIPYEKYTADEFNVSLHAHNDFLEILAETGIFNGIVYFSLFILLLFLNVRNVLKSDNKDLQTVALLALMVLIVLGIDSLFNFPMYRATMQIFFALLLALTIITNTEENKVIAAKPGIINISLIVIVVSIITSYYAFLTYKASNLEYLINTDDINMNDKGFLTGDEVIRRLPKYPNIFSTSESFYEYAGIYYLREQKFDKALQCFSEGNKINPYTGRIAFYKYILYNKKGNYDSAYFFIKEAFYLRPRNMTIYKASTNWAGKRNDTLEIIKEHKLLTQYVNSAEIWQTALKGLKRTSFSKKGLEDFAERGLKHFPKDSILSLQKNEALKEKNAALIAKYITEGQGFYDKKNYNEAMNSYQKGLKIDPDNIYIMQNIGFYYFNLDQYKKAAEYFSKALKYPGLYDGKTEFYLAVSYSITGDKVNACKYVNISKTKNFPKAIEFSAALCR